MAFPEIFGQALEPFDESIEFETRVTRLSGGREQRAAVRLFPLRSVRLRYKTPSPSLASDLWEFYKAMRGALEAFNVFWPYSDVYSDEYVGVGDGSETNYNLPCQNATAYTLEVAGRGQTPGVDYTLTPNGGADGADLIEFAAPPAAGEIILFDFTGTLKMRGRFAEDRLDRQTFYSRIVHTGIEIRGLLNA
jgi:hypothetical protein